MHPRPILVTKVDGRIKRAFGDGKGPQTGAEIDRDLWMRAGKVAQARGQPMHAKGRQNGKVQ